MSNRKIKIEFEVNDGIAIMTPDKGLDAIDFSAFDADAAMLAPQKRPVKNVLIDLRHSDYFGSSVVGWLLALHTRARQNGGFVSICRISDHEQQVLECMSVHRMFHFFATRDEAIEEIKKTSSS